MSRMRVLATVSVVAIALLAAQPAQADRRNGLAESELIEDKDDVFIYPARTVDYTNMVSFEYGASPTSGTALGLFGGEDYAIGVAFQRGDLFEMPGLRTPLPRAGASPATSPTDLTPREFDLDLAHSFPQSLGADRAVDEPASPANASEDGVQGGLTLQRPHMLFDLLGGYDLGKGKIGTRLSVGAGGRGVDSATEERSTQGELYFLFKGGYSGTFGDTTLDTALSFTFNQGDQNDLQSGDNVRQASVAGVAFEGRLDQQMSEKVALGGLFDVGYTSFSLQEDGQDPTVERNFSQFAIQGGAGPVFEIGDTDDAEGEKRARLAQADGETTSQSSSSDEGMSTQTDATATDASTPTPTPEEPPPESSDEKNSFEQSAKIAGYTVFGYRSFGGDPSSEQENDQFTYHSALLPGLHLAGEFQIFKWMYVRSGAQYWFMHLRQGVATSDGDGNNNRNRAVADTSGLGWSAGLGFEVGDFRFDGSLNRNFLRAGPQFIGGAANGLFATASAQYQW